MISVRNAFCLAGARVNRRTTGFGIYAEDGSLVDHTGIRTSSWVTAPRPTASRPKDGSRLFGPALFAGSVDKQFGFILLNSLGRLWALDDLPPNTTILYAAKPQARAPDYKNLPAILHSLGIHNPVLVTESDLSVDELYAVAEVFGESRGGVGTDAFYAWLDRKWPAVKKPDPQDRIYVTRSGLGPRAGRYACEDHLETLLAAEGYSVFSPEAHSVSEQVERFQRAGKLVFAEGSALHLFSLIRRPGQISAVIHRREALPEVMLRQMADRPGAPTIAINAVAETWWPPERGDHLGLSVLDFDKVRDGLTAAGLISGRNWAAPAPQLVQRSLRAGLAEGEDIMTTDQRKIWLRERRGAGE